MESSEIWTLSRTNPFLPIIQPPRWNCMIVQKTGRTRKSDSNTSGKGELKRLPSLVGVAGELTIFLHCWHYLSEIVIRDAGLPLGKRLPSLRTQLFLSDLKTELCHSF